MLLVLTVGKVHGSLPLRRAVQAVALKLEWGRKDCNNLVLVLFQWHQPSDSI